MKPFSPSAQSTDRKQPAGQYVECKLLDISDYFAVGSNPPSWESDKSVSLYTNPQQLQRSMTAIYGAASGLLSSRSMKQYSHSDRSPIKLSGVLVDTGSSKYDATPHLDKLEAMTVASINSYPAVLALVWGARVIQPVVITDLQITETSWANGLVSQASLDITLEYCPSPSYKSNADQRRVEALTEREQKRVKELAEKELKEKPGNKRTSGMAPLPVNSQSKVTNVPNKSGNRQPTRPDKEGNITQGNVIIRAVTK